MITKFTTLVIAFTSAINAVAYDFKVNGICYKTNSETEVAVTYEQEPRSNGCAYTSIGDKIIIPSTVEYNNRSYKVTSIGDEAFFGCQSLKEISLSESLSYIGDYSFEGCSSLSAIEVDVKNPFLTSDNGVLFSGDKTSIIIYPAGKTEKSYSIPDGTFLIKGYAFSSNKNLCSVTMPNSVQIISAYSFYDCTSLNEVFLGKGVRNIEESAFFACSSLKTIDVDWSNKYFMSDNGVLYKSDMKTLFIYPAGKTEKYYTTPNSVTSIAGNAFSYNKNLTSIIISDNVTDIGYFAFYECSKLTKITLGTSTASIGSGAFLECPSLSIINSLNQNPPTGMDGSGLTDEQFKTIQINIPTGSLENYKNNFDWKRFNNFNEIDITGIYNIQADKNMKKNIYNLQGLILDRPERGINVIGGKKILVR